MNPEKVEFGKFDAESLLNEIKSDLGLADGKAALKQIDKKSYENVEETFENLRLFCKNQLSFSFRDVDRMIDNLIAKSEEEVSPLLKFYNELAAHSNFRLPLRSLLQFDVRLFRSQLEKIRRSHNIQLRYVKQSAKNKANDYLRAQFQVARSIMMEEVRICMQQADEVKQAFLEIEKSYNFAQAQLRKQEQTITELRMQLKTYERYLAAQDRDLSILNHGPQDGGGPVVTAARKQNALLLDSDPSEIRN